MKKYLLVLFMALYIAGCLSKKGTVVTPDIIESLSPTVDTVTPTQTPSLIKQPTSNRPQTLTPTSIIRGYSLILTPFTHELKITELLKNPSCDLPCLWNIKLGRTPWKDVNGLLNYLGVKLTTKDVESFSYHSGVLIHGAYFNPGTINIYERNDAVEYMTLAILSDILGNNSTYTPKNILELYGNPSRILVYTTSSGQSLPSFGLEFFYDDLGFMLYYDGQAQNATSSDILLCTNFSHQNVSAVRIYIQSSEIKDPIEKFPDEELQVEQKIVSPYLESVENATGMNITVFRENLLNATYPCFTVKP